jgi:hypothetical protein
MVQLQLKAKHFYFIAFYLKDRSIQQYYSTITRIKTSLLGNTDPEALFTISGTVADVVTIFRILTGLPEGQANTLNVEMDNLLLPQIVLGIADEQAAGIGPDADGNLPENAYWQTIAKGITQIKDSNTAAREAAINEGKNIIDQI